MHMLGFLFMPIQSVVLENVATIITLVDTDRSQNPIEVGEEMQLLTEVTELNLTTMKLKKQVVKTK